MRQAEKIRREVAGRAVASGTAFRSRSGIQKGPYSRMKPTGFRVAGA